MDTPGPELPLPSKTEAVLDGGDGALGGARTTIPLLEPHPGRAPKPTLAVALAIVLPGLNALGIVQRGRGQGVDGELASRQDSGQWTVTQVSSQSAQSSF